MNQKRKLERVPFVAPDGYVTRRAAMEYLGISNQTIYMWELRGLLHPMRVGAYTIYPKKELEKLSAQ